MRTGGFVKTGQNWKLDTRGERFQQGCVNGWGGGGGVTPQYSENLMKFGQKLGISWSNLDLKSSFYLYFVLLLGKK